MRGGSEAQLRGQVLVVIVTDHTAVQRERLSKEAQLILDTREALRSASGGRSNTYELWSESGASFLPSTRFAQGGVTPPRGAAHRGQAWW